MSDFLPDALGIVGLLLLAAGVGLQFGAAWALMVAGLVLMATAVAAARRTGRDK